MKAKRPIDQLLKVMSRLRSPNGGCPWDLEQDHKTLRYYAVEEVYELIDAIEAGDDHAMAEELGDLLLQIVFHAQMARERGAFDFDTVCRHIVQKLVHRHPHVFGPKKVHSAQAVLAQWDQLKHAEKQGTRHERASVFDGIPRHLPALMRAGKLARKARKARLPLSWPAVKLPSRAQLGQALFQLAAAAEAKGWDAENLLRAEITRQERQLRRRERAPRR